MIDARVVAGARAAGYKEIGDYVVALVDAAHKAGIEPTVIAVPLPLSA